MLASDTFFMRNILLIDSVKRWQHHVAMKKSGASEMFEELVSMAGQPAIGGHGIHQRSSALGAQINYLSITRVVFPYHPQVLVPDDILYSFLGFDAVDY